MQKYIIQTIVKGEKTVFIDDVGSILLRKSKKSTKIKISVKPDGAVMVTIPQFLSFDSGFNFLIQKIGWVKDHLVKVASVKKNQTIFHLDEIYKTNFHQVELVRSTVKNIKVITEGLKYFIHIPTGTIVEDAGMQESVRTIFTEIFRREAKAYLPKRTAFLAEKHGLKYEKLFVKNNKTRWGSCSSKNNINLNLHLMRIPRELADYVILHELAHTKEKNHAKSFWKLLDTLTEGKAKFYDKELKKFHSQIF